MEEPTAIPPIAEGSAPRNCPACGSRVADLATTCLMCGASLEAREEPVEAKPQPRLRIPWRGLIGGAFTAVAFLALVWWLVRAQIAGLAQTPLPTFTPAASQTATKPPAPSDTPTPALTATPVPPRVHLVREGDTCVSVAILYGVPLDVLVQLNAEKCGPGELIRPGDPLLIPAATPTAGPTVTVGAGTALPTPECPRLHVVQRGETGLGIAERYNVPFPLIERSNPQVDFAQLPVNQVLQIPCAESEPTPTPTVDPHASPTPIPRYAAPALLSPSDGAEVTGAVVALQWTAVSLLREDEVYAVRLRSLSDTRALESLFTKTTVVRLDVTYAPTADIPVREYSWEVTVVRPSGSASSGETRYTAASQPSVKRTFRWVLVADETTPIATTAP